MSTFSKINPRDYTPINQDNSSHDTDIPESTTNSSILPALVQPSPNAEQHKKLLEQNFINTIPLEVRLQVLNFIVRNRHPAVANEDLISYAKTCKSALADVEEYHVASGQPHQSLLASRTLIKKAWEKAVSNGFLNRANVFQDELKKLATSYTAIYLDARTLSSYFRQIEFSIRLTLPSSPVRLGPESIAAVMHADKLEFIHLKLGFNTVEFHGIEETEYFKKCLTELMLASKDRLQRGIKLPEFFLDVSGLKLSDLFFRLEKAKDKAGLSHSFKISGLSLTSIAASRLIEILSSSENHVFRINNGYDLSTDKWLSCFKKLPQLKYLHLEGWPSDAMAEGLIRWLKKYQQLEELHLSNCGLHADSVRKLCRVLKHSSQLKCLGLDGYQFFDVKAEADLAKLLENNSDLKIIFGKKIATDSPLEFYRLDGRVICERYHKEMRDFPEIYGELDFFSSANQ